MEGKFKIGEKVKVVNRDKDGYLTIGEVVIVESISSQGSALIMNAETPCVYQVRQSSDALRGWFAENLFVKLDEKYVAPEVDYHALFVESCMNHCGTFKSLDEAKRAANPDTGKSLVVCKLVPVARIHKDIAIDDLTKTTKKK